MKSNSEHLKSYYVVKNGDGSIRWVSPVSASKPYFLAFYSITSFKSLLISIYFKVLFLFKIQALFMKKEKLDLKLEELDVFGFDEHANNEWSLFMGTIGPNNKRLLYFRNASDEFDFIKIPTTTNAKRIIENEARVLSHMERNGASSFNFPKMKLYRNEKLLLSDISGEAKRSMNLSSAHLNGLAEIAKIELEKGSDENYNDVISAIGGFIDEFSSVNQQKFPSSIVRKTKELFHILSKYDLNMEFSHGDFTPWNTYLNNNKLAVYDWELADYRTKGFDFFHFIVQKSILVERKSWKETYEEISEIIKNEEFKKFLPEVVENLNLYLSAYFLQQIYDSFKLYSVQLKWHEQILWMIEFWDSALSFVLSKFIDSRTVLLKDTVDFLSNKRYAAVKLEDQPIEELNIFSDVDWCIERKDIKPILSFLKKHPSVFSYSIQVKSFMSSIQMVLKDGSTLNYDFIWKFKVKAIEFLSAKHVLGNRVINSFGVYVFSDLDLARYISLFYFLNGAHVPERYHKSIESLNNLETVLDIALVHQIRNNINSNFSLSVILDDYPVNKKWSGLANRFSYLWDTIRSFFGTKGFLVTFSGVDGAGKSTIINAYRAILEKKYRKKVVVLRHRPSVLPILSVWTKGKKKAHEDVINSLPRQGENSSSLSSIIRFAYYYTDYLFGQFYIYLRYILTGYIVLYDRYYFDFINDSKRSNIAISPAVAKLGYHLLMKPKFNFFLYADPHVIRSRKQELEESDILSLTSKYLDLFIEYDKSKKANYFSLHNTEMDRTLEIIENHTFNYLWKA
ncbi:nucleoside/nucleotide kinase family protein [Marivirga sericea]|nr:hypothetical protein [Marivirga sericea]